MKLGNGSRLNVSDTFRGVELPIAHPLSRLANPRYGFARFVPGRRVAQTVTRGGSASSGTQALGRRDRRGGRQSKGCSTAWRMRPNHQCARFNCRARDRGGPPHGRLSKPSCNCPLGMRNRFFGMPTRRTGHLTEQRLITTLAAVRQTTDFVLYASPFLTIRIGPSLAAGK